MKESGIIKWFDASKGFGVIETPNNGEYFLHKSNIQDKSLELAPKTPVIFTPDFERNKKTAKNCHLPQNTDDLFTILLLIGNNRTVSIKTKIKGTSRWGNPYVRDEFISYDVLEISLKYIFNEKSEVDLFPLVTDAYIKIKDTVDKFDYNNFFQVITKHINQLQIVDSPQFIDKLYRFFGENLSNDILFSIWKSKNFHFISKSEYEDYEIPENVFLQNTEELKIEDLNRIQKYEGGANTCFKIVSEKVEEISNQTPSETIIEIFKFLEFVKDDKKKKKLLNALNKTLYKNTLDEINVRLSKLPPISDKTILSQYNNLNQLIPTEISEKQKVELSKIISETIINKSSEQVKTDLWLSDYIDEIENTQIIELLCNENIQISDKLKALAKTHNSDQITLILEQLLDKQKLEEIFELIEQFVKQENDLGYYFELKSAIATGDFRKDKIGYNLLKTFQTIITERTTKEEQANLYFEGWLDNYPPDYILYTTQNLSAEELKKILKNNNTEKDYRFKLLETKCKDISNEETDWFLKICQEFLSDEEFKIIDNLIVDQTTDEVWFELWTSKATKVLQKQYLIAYFNEDQSKYKEIHNWINNDIISKEKISDFLYEKLALTKNITDRVEFYTASNIIQTLIELDSKWVDNISSLKNNFFNLLLWHLGFKNDFDFDTLKGKFIYFNPIDQVYLFKRLFYLKHTKKIDFTFDELDEIVRADVDLFLTNEKFNTDFVLDISTHILIEAIKSYQTKNNFLFESDLILKDLKNNTKKRFRIEDYFEECPGRLIADWNWNTNGKIKKNPFPNNNERFYYSVEFESAFPREGRNYYGSYTYHEKNPMFETLKDDVKKISGRKWNPDKKHWGVPSNYENEVFEFAKKHKFFIDLGNRKHYDNNTHLVEYSRDEKPNGIRFCEGRKSNKKHNKLHSDFWWCSNQPCFKFAEIDHLSNDFLKQEEESKEVWEYYKFIDFLRILNINTDEHKEAPIDLIPDGNYYKFIGHINAFNRLIDKLYCHKCNELLYPTETSHFALYRDTKFHCENENCSEHKKTIYLNHCLNGECGNIIDSRISKTCDNGLYICDSCGSCCSNSMFKRRLDNLKLVGGYIHPELIKNVEEENGHLEKAEYYCYKCKGMMTEINEKKYKCDSCNVSYDFDKFKWLDKKWMRKNQRRTDYPVYRKNDDYDEPF